MTGLGSSSTRLAKAGGAVRRTTPIWRWPRNVEEADGQSDVDLFAGSYFYYVCH